MPSELKPDLERMEAAVNQYRFGDATQARAALDTYAAAHCAPEPPTSQSPVTAPGATVTPSTTVAPTQS
jgi:hypothetical protein